MSRQKIPPFLSFDLNRFSEKFRTESDRACAVLGAAMLDALLESLFRRRLCKSSSTKLDQLFDGGALSSFAGKIRLAAALAWIEEDVRADLELIRKIRNDFAHSFEETLEFEDEEHALNCNKLRVANALIKANEEAAVHPHPNFSREVISAMAGCFNSPRQRFMITIEIVAQYLNNLPEQAAVYEGPNLADELNALVGVENIHIQASATVESLHDGNLAEPIGPESDTTPVQIRPERD